MNETNSIQNSKMIILSQTFNKGCCLQDSGKRPQTGCITEYKPISSVEQAMSLLRGESKDIIIYFLPPGARNLTPSELVNLCKDYGGVRL